MNKRQDGQYHSIKDGVMVLEPLPDVPEFRSVRRLRDELRAHREILGELILAQYMAAQKTGVGVELEALKKDLREVHLIRTVRRARRLFKQEPRLLKVLRVPKKRATALVHANASLAIARALRPHLAFCYAEGFRKGFLTELRQAANHLRSRAKSTGRSRTALSGITWRIKHELHDARELMPIIESELRATGRGRPGKGSVEDIAASFYVAWKAAVRIGKPLGRPRRRRNDNDQKSDEAA